MAIGRITGPLLNNNLLRNSTDLAIETNLLFFDVNSHAADVQSYPDTPTQWSGKIGIKTDTPSYDLDINGAARSTRLLSNTVDIGDIQITNNTISSFNSNINFTVSETKKVIINNLQVLDELIFNSVDSPTIATSIATDSQSFNLINTTALTVNFAGEATDINIGAGTGTTTINNDLNIPYGRAITIDGQHGQYNQYLKYTETGVKWADVSTSTISITDNSVSNQPFYPIFTSSSTESFASVSVSSNKFNFVPLTGTLTVAGDINVGTDLNVNGDMLISGSLQIEGTTSGTWSGSFGAVSGANLTNLTAGNLSGTIPSAVLGNSTVYVGTTAVTLNRATGPLALTGINSVTLPGSTSGSVQVIPTATAGTDTILTLPATTGTVITTGDSGTVTNIMLAGSIANAKLVNSTISGVSLGSNLNTLTIGTGLSGTSYNGSSAVTIAIDSTVATLTGIQSLTNKTLVSPTINTSVLSGSSSIDLFNTTATTLNIGGDATTISIGALTGTTTINHDLTVTGNFIVDGTTTIIDTETTTIVDPIINIGGSSLEPLTINDFKDRGITFNWYNGTSAKVGFFGYDNSSGHFVFIPDATINDKIVSGSLGVIDATTFNGDLIGSNIVSNDNLTTLGNVYITPDLTSVLTIFPQSLGNIDNVQIGASTRAEGYFTFLSSNTATLTDDISSTDITTGTLVVTGGVGISENLNVGNILTTVDLTVSGTVNFDAPLSVLNGGTGYTTATKNGILFGNDQDPIQVTLSSNPGLNATTSFGILSTDINNIPTWTDVIDEGEY